VWGRFLPAPGKAEAGGNAAIPGKVLSIADLPADFGDAAP